MHIYIYIYVSLSLYIYIYLYKGVRIHYIITIPAGDGVVMMANPSNNGYHPHLYYNNCLVNPLAIVWLIH